jgi:molybdate transport system substrate-binding protein
MSRRANPSVWRRLPALVAAALVAVLAAPAAASALTVSAAASLRDVLPAIDSSPTYNFGGSDSLALQIRSGAPADVFLSANLSIPAQLHREGRCSKPQVFATNVLVLVTPKANPAGVTSVYDLGRGPTERLAVGSPTVPVGSYTRQVLGRLGLSRALRINTVSSESNVGSIVSKVALGSADAGFVYVTDWLAARDRLGRIGLPRFAQPPIRYGLCIVKRDGVDRAAAARFVRTVLGPTGRKQLRAFGFGVPRLS